VLSLAHALERHKTLSGDDVVAVLECRQGPIVDGRIYDDPAFVAELEAYHEAAVEAHRRHTSIAAPLPAPRHPEPEIVQGELVSVDGRSAAASSNGTGKGWPPPPLPDAHAEAMAAPEDEDVSEKGGAGSPG
jgi:cell division protease FtsH